MIILSFLLGTFLAIGLLFLLEHAFQSVYGPIRYGFVRTTSPSIFSYRRELPWCGICDLDPKSIVSMDPKRNGEIRILWVGESSVDGYPRQEWVAASMLDFLLKKFGEHNVIQIKMAQGGGMTTDLMLMAETFPLKDIDISVFYFGINDYLFCQSIDRYIFRISPNFLKFSKNILDHSRLAFFISRKIIEQLLREKHLPSLQSNNGFLIRDYSPNLDAEEAYFRQSAQTLIDWGLERSDRLLLLPFVLNEEDFDHNYFSAIHKAPLQEKLESFRQMLESGKREEAIQEMTRSQDTPVLAAAMGFISYVRRDFDIAKLYVVHRDQQMKWIDSVNDFLASQRDPKISVLKTRDSFESISPTGKPGVWTHLDRVHPSMEGQYAIATLVYQQLRTSLLPDLPKEPPDFSEFLKVYRKKLNMDDLLKRVLVEDVIRTFPLEMEAFDRAAGGADPRFALALASLYSRLGNPALARRELKRAEEITHGKLDPVISEMQSLAGKKTASLNELQELLRTNSRYKIGRNIGPSLSH